MGWEQLFTPYSGVEDKYNTTKHTRKNFAHREDKTFVNKSTGHTK